MRKDVKLGLLFSFVVVVGAGWYYVSKDKTEEPLALDDASTTRKAPVAQADTKKPTVLADARKSKSNRAVNRKAPSRRTGSKQSAQKRAGTRRPPAKTPAHKPASTKRKPTVTAAPPTTKTAPKPTGNAMGSAKAKPADSVHKKPVHKKHSRKPDHKKAEAKKSSGDKTSKNAVKNLFHFDGGATVAKQPPATKAKSGLARDTPPGTPKARGHTKTAKGVRTHTVKRGDTYALMAEFYYGSQRHARFLMNANPEHSDPRRLREGMVLRVPPLTVQSEKPRASKASGRTSTVVGQRTYVARAGDSFYTIAARKLGSGSRWPELFELNKDTVGGKPERLRIGQVLVLPPEKPTTNKKK